LETFQTIRIEGPILPFVIPVPSTGGANLVGFCEDRVRPIRKQPAKCYDRWLEQTGYQFSAAATYLKSWPDEPVRRKPWKKPKFVEDISGPLFGQWWGPDTVRFHLSGAASDGGAQAAQSASLGNYRSSTEAICNGVFYSRAVVGVTIGRASRQDGGGGTGVIQANLANGLSYAGQSGTQGAAITVPDGATRILQDGSDPSKYVRVTRSRASDMVGQAVVTYHDQFNDVWAMSDANNTLSVAGGSRYRGIVLRAMNDVSSLKVWIDTLGPSAVSSVTQLGASGAGTVAGAADCFIGWPQKGWAFDATSAERFYYSSRTNSALTVPSAGRHLLGTSAAAGGVANILWPIPGIRIALEEPSPAKNAAIQTIASESTAPAAVSWNTGITSGTGLSYATLRESCNAGLWLHRELPAGTGGFSKHEVAINYSFVEGGVTYTGSLAGLFRVAQDSLERYELHIGTDAEPDISAAATATFTSLPYLSSALAVNHTYYMVTNYRNRYDLKTESKQSTVLVVKSDGTEGIAPPIAADAIIWEAAADGTFHLEALYRYLTDGANPADYFAIYIRTNGTDPDIAIDTPTLVAMSYDGHASAWLDYDTAGFANGTDGRVIVRTKRSSDGKFSTASAVFTAVATTTVPGTPGGGIFYLGVAEPK